MAPFSKGKTQPCFMFFIRGRGTGEALRFGRRQSQSHSVAAKTGIWRPHDRLLKGRDWPRWVAEGGRCCGCCFGRDPDTQCPNAQPGALSLWAVCRPRDSAILCHGERRIQLIEDAVAACGRPKKLDGLKWDIADTCLATVSFDTGGLGCLY
jgi:hypothetical protein